MVYMWWKQFLLSSGLLFLSEDYHCLCFHMVIEILTSSGELTILHVSVSQNKSVEEIPKNFGIL